MAMSKVVLLASEVEKLRVENQRQKKKRAQKRLYIAKGGILVGTEGAARAQTAQDRAAGGVAEIVAERPQRAKPKCSICAITDHNARTCARSRQLASISLHQMQAFVVE
jgi:hypothetical protein